MVAVDAAFEPINIMPIENPFLEDDNGHARVDHFEQTFRLRLIDLEKPDEDIIHIEGFYDPQQDEIVIQLKREEDELHFGSTSLVGQLGALLFEWTAGRAARFVEAEWRGWDGVENAIRPPLPPLNDTDAFLQMRFEQMRNNVFALSLEVQLLPRQPHEQNPQDNNNIENPMDEDELNANMNN